MKQKGFLLAAGFSLAFALTFSCSGDDGSPGKNGIDGEDGSQCTQGVQGIQGEQGLQGATGEGCSMKSITEGIEITCGSQVDTLKNGSDGTVGIQGIQGPEGATGSDGKNCEAEQSDDGIITITCGENVVGIAFCGDDNKFYNPIYKLCDDGILKDIFTDSRDNKKYVYVEIGDYIWMTENLVYGKADGKYTWAEALDACPIGWELPTKDAVEDVVTNNETEFLSILSDGSWWTNNENTSSTAYYYGYVDDDFFVTFGGKSGTYFIRCVKAN